jgi:hypothetical protein
VTYDVQFIQDLIEENWEKAQECTPNSNVQSVKVERLSDSFETLESQTKEVKDMTLKMNSNYGGDIKGVYGGLCWHPLPSLNWYITLSGQNVRPVISFRAIRLLQ